MDLQQWLRQRALEGAGTRGTDIRGELARINLYALTELGLPAPRSLIEESVQWHLADPPEHEEEAHNFIATDYQWNDNPFVTDPGAVQRLRCWNRPNGSAASRGGE